MYEDKRPSEAVIYLFSLLQVFQISISFEQPTFNIMKLAILSAIFLSFGMICFSQDTINLFLDGNFVQTPQESASIKRTAVIKNNHYYITDRFINGTMIHYGEYASVNPWIEDGLFRYYDPSGNLEVLGSFVNGNLSGQWVYFNKENPDTIDYSRVENYFKLRKDSCKEFTNNTGNERYPGEIIEIETELQKFIESHLHIPARYRYQKDRLMLKANFILDTIGCIKCPYIEDCKINDYTYETLRILFYTKVNT